MAWTDPPVTPWTDGQKVVAWSDLFTYIFENLRAIASWTQRPFSAGNFTAGAATWTVDSSDQRTFAYKIYGNTMVVSLSIGTTSFSGTASELSISIPESKVATREMIQKCQLFDNSLEEAGTIFVQPSGPPILVGSAAGALPETSV